jgi:hypothetical protein
LVGISVYEFKFIVLVVGKVFSLKRTNLFKILKMDLKMIQRIYQRVGQNKLYVENLHQVLNYKSIEPTDGNGNGYLILVIYFETDSLENSRIR